MDFQKIKYSKCPSCKRNGISSFEKLGRLGAFRIPTVSCKYCKKNFKANALIVVGGQISIVLFVSIIYNLIPNEILGKCVFGVVLVLLLYAFEYFIPLEEKSKTGDG